MQRQHFVELQDSKTRRTYEQIRRWRFKFVAVRHYTFETPTVKRNPLKMKGA